MSRIYSVCTHDGKHTLPDKIKSYLWLRGANQFITNLSSNIKPCNVVWPTQHIYNLHRRKVLPVHHMMRKTQLVAVSSQPTNEKDIRNVSSVINNIVLISISLSLFVWSSKRSGLLCLLFEVVININQTDIRSVAKCGQPICISLQTGYSG